jgi:hypothetical protein
VFELGLELLSCLGNNANRLLVITVNDRGNTSIEVELIRVVIWSIRWMGFHEASSKTTRVG